MQIRTSHLIDESALFVHLFFPEAISYGRTVERVITKEPGYLSYPASAIVMVFSKQTEYNDRGEEFWEAEVREGRKKLGGVDGHWEATWANPLG